MLTINSNVGAGDCMEGGRGNARGMAVCSFVAKSESQGERGRKREEGGGGGLHSFSLDNHHAT